MTRLLALACLLALPGCVSVLPEARPAAPRYLIEAAAYEGPEAPAVAWSLAVEDPAATRAYDTAKIAVVRAPGRLEYLANGEWADRAPRLLQAALVRSLENTGRILGVGDRGSLPSSDFILQTDIRALHVDYVGDAPAASVAVYAKLTNARGKILAARLFEARGEVGRGTPADIGAAFDGAVEEVLRTVVEWSFAESERAYAK